MSEKKYKIPHEIDLGLQQVEPDYTNEYAGGQHKYNDFKFFYDFWAEPPLNQGNTGTCVLHSHIGAIGKLTRNSLSAFSIVGLMAEKNLWNGSGSRAFAEKLNNRSYLLVPSERYRDNIVLNNKGRVCLDPFYKGYPTNPSSFVINESEYNSQHEDILNAVTIEYQHYGPKAYDRQTCDEYDSDLLINKLKDIINSQGVAMVSLDYPSKIKDGCTDSNKYKSLTTSCFGQLWIKNQISGNYWYARDNQRELLTNWFNDTRQNQDWHSIIVFAYAEDGNGHGVFAYKNSWGTQKGENGTYYISMDFMRLLVKYRRGKVSVTSIHPKSEVSVSNNHDAFMDYMQYNNPNSLTKSISVKRTDVSNTNMSNNEYWYYNFADNVPVSIGTGFWTFVGNFELHQKYTYIVKEFSERDGKGEELNAVTAELTVQDECFDFWCSDPEKISCYNDGKVL